MRKLTQFLFLFSTLSAFVACSGGEDSLGTKNDSQQGDGKCSGPNPASLGCADGAACPTGMVCDPDACHSSHCSCDEASGNWQCTANCGTPTCVPENSGPKCEARNPSLGCSEPCPTGTTCNEDACRPSSCTCGENGDWLCTRDCGGTGACVPDQGEPKECPGPNPAAGCGAGCPTGTVCDYGACTPSGCGCDPATGFWTCTADCGSGGSCVPEESATCTNGYYGSRAPEGDALCTGKPDCFRTSGLPPQTGCPSTCNCTCIRGMCFAGMCTSIICDEPPIYR
jgi:hypothetical protein